MRSPLPAAAAFGLFLSSQARYSFRHGVDDHRHEAVVFAAQLGALAAVGSGLFDLHPGFPQKAGNGIALDAELGHHQVWMTSVEVSRTRTFLPTGTTGLSTSSR